MIKLLLLILSFSSLAQSLLQDKEKNNILKAYVSTLSQGIYTPVTYFNNECRKQPIELWNQKCKDSFKSSWQADQHISNESKSYANLKRSSCSGSVAMMTYVFNHLDRLNRQINKVKRTSVSQFIIGSVKEDKDFIIVFGKRIDSYESYGKLIIEVKKENHSYCINSVKKEVVSKEEYVDQTHNDASLAK